MIRSRKKTKESSFSFFTNILDWKRTDHNYLVARMIEFRTWIGNTDLIGLWCWSCDSHMLHTAAHYGLHLLWSMRDHFSNNTTKCVKIPLSHRAEGGLSKQGSNTRRLLPTRWIFLPKGSTTICWSLKFPRSLWGLKAKVWFAEGRIIWFPMQPEQTVAHACWRMWSGFSISLKYP